MQHNLSGYILLFVIVYYIVYFIYIYIYIICVYLYTYYIYSLNPTISSPHDDYRGFWSSPSFISEEFEHCFSPKRRNKSSFPSLGCTTKGEWNIQHAATLATHRKGVESVSDVNVDSQRLLIFVKIMIVMKMRKNDREA